MLGRRRPIVLGLDGEDEAKPSGSTPGQRRRAHSVAQWIERRPPEPDGLSVVLALRDPDGNWPGSTL